MQKFIKFFDEFIDPRTGSNLYPELLREVLEEGICPGSPSHTISNVYTVFLTDLRHINLDCKNLHEFDPDLYRQLVFYPAEVIPIFDMCIDRITQRDFPEMTERERTQVK